jgi:hypothetical protein
LHRWVLRQEVRIHCICYHADTVLPKHRALPVSMQPCRQPPVKVTLQACNWQRRHLLVWQPPQQYQSLLNLLWKGTLAS